MTHVLWNGVVGTWIPVVGITRINGETSRRETLRFVPYVDHSGSYEPADEEPALPGPMSDGESEGE